jgi:hypothetical protein
MSANKAFSALAVLSLALGIGAVVWMVLRRVLLLAAVGLVISVPAALGASQLVKSFLFGTRPNDPGTLALAGVVLLSAVILAGYAPARRASRIDPLAALRRSALKCAVRNRVTKETTELNSLGWDRGRGRSDVLDDAASGGWVEIKLTETPDTDPCTQAPVSWRNGDDSLGTSPEHSASRYS